MRAREWTDRCIGARAGHWVGVCAIALARRRGVAVRIFGFGMLTSYISIDAVWKNMYQHPMVATVMHTFAPSLSISTVRFVTIRVVFFRNRAAARPPGPS